jgi:hypothetical protein
VLADAGGRHISEEWLTSFSCSFMRYRFPYRTSPTLELVCKFAENQRDIYDIADISVSTGLEISGRFTTNVAPLPGVF